jgi:hypothetical protein
MKQRIRRLVKLTIGVMVLIAAGGWWCERLGIHFDWPDPEESESPIRVQNLPSEWEDLRGVLHVHMWRMNVTIPQSDKPQLLWIVFRNHGKLVEHSSSSSVFLPKAPRPSEVRVMVASEPVGVPLSEADVLQVRLGGNGLGARTVFTNPFKGYGRVNMMQHLRFWDNEAIVIFGQPKGGFEVPHYISLPFREEHDEARNAAAVMSLVFRPDRTRWEDFDK